MVLVMPSRMPQSSAGVWRVPPKMKKRLLIVHSVSSSFQFKNRLSKVPAAIDSRLARILFRKLVDLICGDSASGRLRLVLAMVRATPSRERAEGVGWSVFAMMTTVARGQRLGSRPISPVPRETVIRRYASA